MNPSRTTEFCYDDENQLIEMRTDTYYPSAANRFKTTWTYDWLGRVRICKEYYWYEYYRRWAQNDEVRYVYDLPAALVPDGLRQASGMRVIQERNSGNTQTVVYTRGNDLPGSLEGARIASIIWLSLLIAASAGCAFSKIKHSHATVESSPSYRVFAWLCSPVPSVGAEMMARCRP